jgi:hypothetical protein
MDKFGVRAAKMQRARKRKESIIAGPALSWRRPRERKSGAILADAKAGITGSKAPYSFSPFSYPEEGEFLSAGLP